MFLCSVLIWLNNHLAAVRPVWSQMGWGLLGNILTFHIQFLLAWPDSSASVGQLAMVTLMSALFMMFAWTFRTVLQYLWWQWPKWGECRQLIFFIIGFRKTSCFWRHAILNDQNVPSTLFMSPGLWQWCVFSSEDQFVVESPETHSPQAFAQLLHTLFNVPDSYSNELTILCSSGNWRQ